MKVFTHFIAFSGSPRSARLLWSVLVALLLGIVPAAAQQKSTVQQESTTVRENTAVIGTADGEERVSTSDIRSIRFDGSMVTVSRPWGDQTYDGTLRNLTFLRPLPGTLRLTVSAALDNDGYSSGDANASRRAFSGLRNTWEANSKVYVYTDDVGTTPIGTLTPQTTGTSTTSLVGDIDGSQLTNGQTLYLSTVKRPHSFANQTGVLGDLFYATATASVTIVGANATISSAVFQNPQSITAFTLKDGYGYVLQVAKLVISSGVGEDITVTPPAAATTLYVAMPATGEQTVYTFIATTLEGEERKGTKKANVQDGKYYTASVTVKLTPTYTAPAARLLIYNGKAQNLVTAGSSGDGTFTYSTSKDGEYTATLPQGTNAGSYSVWYKVKGVVDCNDIAATEVTDVSIEKAGVPLTATDINFGGTTGSKSVVVTEGDGSSYGAVSAVVTSGRGCSVSVKGNTLTITRTLNKAFNATVTVRTARTANYKETMKCITVSGITVYPVESVKVGNYQCAKVYTGDKVGYYIMCTDHSSMNWTDASKVSVSAGGRTFTCGSKEDWEAIMSACGGTGYNSINTMCGKVTGWKAMEKNAKDFGYYWSKTGAYSVTHPWSFNGTGWYPYSQQASLHVRLVSPFSDRAKGDVESATVGGYQCAKVYTSPTTGYYIMCTDHSASMTWADAGKVSVSTGVGKPFTCGSKADWEAIMSAFGGTGHNSINSKCSGVTGWSALAFDYYWTSTEYNSDLGYDFYATALRTSKKTLKNRVRLISRFGHERGEVESVTIGSYQCAKIYTSATSGYYVMCADVSTSTKNWDEACKAGVFESGKTFSCGTKADWQAITSACGGTGYKYVNSKCSGVTGWSDLHRLWSSTEYSKNTRMAWIHQDSNWKIVFKSVKARVRLVSAF